VIDAEHSPNDPRSVAAAIAGHGGLIRCMRIVRPVLGSVELIKQYLDIGAADTHHSDGRIGGAGARMVAAMRYPTAACAASAAPRRAPRVNQIDDYLLAATTKCACRAGESVNALANLESIAAVTTSTEFFRTRGLGGIDGTARRLDRRCKSPSFRGSPRQGPRQVAGTLTSDRALRTRVLERGAQFVAVGVEYDDSGEFGRALAAALPTAAHAAVG